MPRRRPVPRALRDRAKDNRARDARTPDRTYDAAESDAHAEPDAHEGSPAASDRLRKPSPVRRRDGSRPSPRPRQRPAPSPAGRRASTPAAARPRRKRPSGPWAPPVWGIAVVAALAVLAWVVGAATFLGANRAEAAASAEKSAVAAASSAAEVVLSYDYRSMDKTIKAARDRSTGAFAEEYADTSKVLKAQAPKVKAVVRADVVAASLVRAETNRAVILVFVNQATQNTTISGGSRVDQNRVRMTMERRDGRWLVSGVDAL